MKIKREKTNHCSYEAIYNKITLLQSQRYYSVTKAIPCHQNVSVQLKSSAYNFFFHNFLIFVCELKKICFYFSEENECFFSHEKQQVFEKNKIYIFLIYMTKIRKLLKKNTNNF